MEGICALNGCGKQVTGRCYACRQAYCSVLHAKKNWKTHETSCKLRSTPGLPLDPDSPLKTSPVVVLLDMMEGQHSTGTIEKIKYLEPLFNALRRVSTLKSCRLPSTLLSLLCETTPRPQALLVGESQILMNPKCERLVDLIVHYVKTGGCVVFACQCPSFTTPSTLNKFFAEKLKLSWRFGGHYRTRHFLQKSHPLVTPTSLEILPHSCSMYSVNLTGVAAGDKLYAPKTKSRVQSLYLLPTPVELEHTPVAMTKVGDGWVGWNGDVNGEAGSLLATLAMLGLPITKETNTPQA